MYNGLLDDSKALDAVAHETVYNTLDAPKGFSNFLRKAYEGGGTMPAGNGWVSEASIPAREVKQGDSLSSILDPIS